MLEGGTVQGLNERRKVIVIKSKTVKFEDNKMEDLLNFDSPKLGHKLITAKDESNRFLPHLFQTEQKGNANEFFNFDFSQTPEPDIVATSFTAK